MEFLFCVFSSNPCILCASPYLVDIEIKFVKLNMICWISLV